ncbi:MAG: putative manganese transporter [Bacteroidales bacterium]|nr:putative manganese transporter [Bacteroidales bacterium]
MLEFFNDVVVQSILITFFVLAMILVIEYINVISQGAANKFMQSHTSLQIIISSILGIIPGCVGTYTAVSLYTHDVIGFGALMANLIATTGDEAFFMITLMPNKAAIIAIILLILSIVLGYVIHFITKKRRNTCGQNNHFELHQHHDNLGHISLRPTLNGLKHPSFKRVCLIISIIVFSTLVLTGILKSNHNHGEIHNHDNIENVENHNSNIYLETEHQHHHEHHGLDPVTITFLVLSALALFVSITVPDHFLEEHIISHVIAKHLPKVFGWTFAALLIIFFINKYIDVNSWVENNIGYVLIIALLVGLIPESGPHLIFITLFIEGSIPFGVLLANCIVQDGHGAIPLFAESKKDFFIAKAIKLIIAAFIGFLMIDF